MQSRVTWFKYLGVGVFLAAVAFGQEMPQGSQNLGEVINSKYSDFAPFVSADGKSLYFASNREGGFGGQDIWVSRRGQDGKWGPPINLGEPINTKYNEGPDTFSLDEKTMFVTGCHRPDGLGQCDIYVSHLQADGKWSAVKNLGAPINTKLNEANASLSADGRTLYFVSTRPTGLGGWDIWVSHSTDGNWSEPENLGPTINTPMNEFIAFIHTNDQVLDFSSDGHGGFGGTDIFRTRKTPTGWSEPENLGPMINTPYNDMYFSYPGAGDLAYFCSNRGDTVGMEDIYTVPVALCLQRQKNAFILGTVADLETCAPPDQDQAKGTPIYNVKTCTPIPDAEVRVAYLDSDKEVAQLKSQPNGSYQVVLPPAKSYSISAATPGYLFHSDKITIPPEAPYQVIEKNLLLQKVMVVAKEEAPKGQPGKEQPGKVELTQEEALKPILFDFDKTLIQPEFKDNLTGVINLLLQNPNLRIEIQGYTDAIGTDEYNLGLSRRRAKAVSDYLVRTGNIAPARLVIKGLGKKMPAASNDTEEHRRKNRRVEFKILE